MSVNLKVDDRDLNRKFREYQSYNRRSNAELINAKMLQLGFEAMKETVPASKFEIQNLDQLEWWPNYISFRMRKEGKEGAKRGSFAFHAYRGEAEKFGKKVIAARLRSRAFLKSGYLPAIRVLYPRVKDLKFRRTRVEGGKQYGKDKGTGKPARIGPNTYAEIVNSAQGIEKEGMPAMKRAVQTVILDMHEYITRKKQEGFDRIK